MKQLQPSVKGQQGLLPLSDPAMVKRWPLICEYLAMDSYDDEAPRQRSTITLFSQDGLVKVALNDKDANMTLFRSGSGVNQALDALEKDLASGEPLDWKAWKMNKRGK